MSLRSKLSTVLLPLVIVPILLLGGVVYSFLQSSARNQMELWTRQYIHHQRDNFEGILQRVAANLAILEGSSRLKLCFQTTDPYARIYLFQSAVLEDFAAIQATSADLLTLRLLRSDGTVEIVRRQAAAQAVADDTVFAAEIRPFARALRSGETRWRLGRTCPTCSTARLWVLRAFSVHGWAAPDPDGGAAQTGTTGGVLVATVDMEAWRLGLATHARMTAGGSLAVMDRSGTLLFAPDWETLKLDRVLPLPARRRLIEDVARETTLDRCMVRAGDDAVVYLAALGEGLFLMAAVVVRRSAFQPGWLVPLVLALTAFGVLLFSLAHQFAMRRIVLRPLARLAERAEAIGRGRVDQPIRLESRDELDQLASALERMRINLNAHQQSLKGQVRVAEASEKAKSAFLATMSHEIRTPLNGVLGAAQLLEGTELTAEQFEYLQIISRTGTQLLGVINDLLDFSRMDYDALLIRKAPFDLYDVMETVIDVLVDRANNRGLQVYAVYSADLPRVYIGDELRIQQVMQNLINNAIKFTPSGRVVLRILAADTKAGAAQGIRLSVSDTGIGIDAKVRDSIFEPFTRIENGSGRIAEGTGLGLAICRRLTDLMGGRIAVDSTPGEGATFEVTLPLEPAEEAGRGTAVPALPRGRVVVVSVEAEFCEAATQLFRRLGRETLTLSPAEVPSALAGLEGAAADPSSLLVDGGLPAWVAAGTLRAADEAAGARFEARLVAATPQERGLLERHLHPWPVTYLAKPVTLKRLHRALAGAAQAPAPAAGAGPRRSVPAASPAGNRPVLLVEDNPTNQIITRTMLEGLDCRVDIAGDGSEALRFFRNRAYDLVFMDCHLPGMDGLKCAKAIRQMEHGLGRPPVPIIALTANVMQTGRDACLAAGMNDFLSKPFRLKDLERLTALWAPSTAGPCEPTARRQAADERRGQEQEQVSDRDRDQASPTPAAFPAFEAGSAIAETGDLFDRSALESLQAVPDGKGNESLRQAVEYYLDSAPEILTELRSAVEQGDAERMQRQLEALELSSRQLGLHALATHCRALQIKVEAGLPVDMPAAAVGIEALFERSAEALLAFSRAAEPDAASRTAP